LLKHIRYERLALKLKKKLSENRGGALLIIAMSFLPILIIIAYLGVQFANNNAAFRQNRKDLQTYYVAEMGIERYKNEIKANPTYSDELDFTKTIDGEDYNIEVTSTREGAPEMVRITSTVVGTNITVTRVITVSKITS